MVALLVYKRADSEEEQGVAYCKAVHNQAGNFAVYNYAPEILDINEDWVQVEYGLYLGRICVNGIEYCGHIHKKHRENAPQILNISEENEKSRENKSHAKIEYNHADNGNYKHKEKRSKYNTVNKTEYQEYEEGKTEIYKRRDISGKEE